MHSFLTHHAEYTIRFDPANQGIRTATKEGPSAQCSAFRLPRVINWSVFGRIERRRGLCCCVGRRIAIGTGRRCCLFKVGDLGLEMPQVVAETAARQLAASRGGDLSIGG